MRIAIGFEKAGHRYCLLCDRDEASVEKMRDMIGRWAEDSELNWSWFDAIDASNSLDAAAAKCAGSGT